MNHPDLRRFSFLMLASIILVQQVRGQDLKVNGNTRAEDSEWVRPDASGIPVLMVYLKDPEPLVVRGALQDFATRGAQARPALRQIRELIRHRNGLVAIDAAWSLIDLKVDAGFALKTIIQTTRVKDPVTRAYAARALGEIVQPPFTISCWGPDPRPQTPRPELSKQVVPVLTWMLKDMDTEVRLAAAKALIGIDPANKSVVPVLQRVLQETDEGMRNEATRLLLRIEAQTAQKAGVK